MAVCKSNMLWVAEHIHYFEFHTLPAQQLQMELQSWWLSERDDADTAADLQRRFLRLCKSNPLEAACGWFRHSGQRSSRHNDLPKYCDTLPQTCDISVTCLDACYLPEHGCFYGMLNPALQTRTRQDLLTAYHSKLQSELTGAGSVMRAKMTEFITGDYEAIYSRNHNFTLFKGAVHLLLYLSALRLIPTWWKAAVGFVSALISTSFDLEASIQHLCIPFPDPVTLPLAVAVMILVPAVVLDFRQTVCEIWFGICRYAAKTTLNRRYRRSLRALRRMQKRASRKLRTMIRSDRLWHRAKKSCCGSLVFRMPGWVRIGTRACFKRKIPFPFFKSLRFYPQFPPVRRTWRSRPFFRMLLRTAILYCFMSLNHFGGNLLFLEQFLK